MASEVMATPLTDYDLCSVDENNLDVSIVTVTATATQKNKRKEIMHITHQNE